MNKKKVLLVSEYLNPPYDEGIKKTVYNLFINLDKKYEVQAICRYGFKQENIHIVETNKLFFAKEIKRIITHFNPDTLIYFPFQSSTFASYLRLKILSNYSKNSNSIFIALQPKQLKSWQQNLVKYLKPKIALTPSPTLKKFWDKNGIDAKQIPLLTNLSIFKPLADTNQKKDLRLKYNLPSDAFIISHMGHLNQGRNLKSLIPLQKFGHQVVVVASSSTPEDAKEQSDLKETLEKQGIIIIDRFIENIEEVYQLSDIYIFPVVKENSSIGMPLSVLEARACGCPVVTTNYGSLELFLNNDNNSIVYSTPNSFLEAVNSIKNRENANFKNTMVNTLNDQFYKTISNLID
ncbi:glycosyltransferase family 1 protein [Aureibaculum marinum]|uniref:Glycosyltransferase family 1 protein n=1 Tax=Aureibaculum marinum TaxID=2487930 RepID=A0A3N4PEP7_9FLAO|nr:glycosyltransferase [Aureibaculum marinum]RPD98003.1 glycosyltransferase family 1 protein [Aureibaculum marinum]